MDFTLHKGKEFNWLNDYQLPKDSAPWSYSSYHFLKLRNENHVRELFIYTGIYTYLVWSDLSVIAATSFSACSANTYDVAMTTPRDVTAENWTNNNRVKFHSSAPRKHFV
jgi:hypothetical protein